MISFWILFGISVLAGFVGAISGMGGGVIFIPVLTSLGVDIKRAVAISLLSMVAVSIGAASNYVKGHLANLKVSAFFEIFAVTGALAGALLNVVSAQRPLFFLCGLILLASWVLLWSERYQQGRAVSISWREAHRFSLEGSYYDQVERRTIHYRGRHPVLSGSLMFLAGAVSGMLGIGASAFTVLIHNLVLGLPQKVASTTSNLIIGAMALAGASIYLEAGLIDAKLVAPMILGVLLGAFLGTKLLVRFTNQVARRIFLVVLPIMGVQMLLHGLWG